MVCVPTVVKNIGDPQGFIPPPPRGSHAYLVVLDALCTQFTKFPGVDVAPAVGASAAMAPPGEHALPTTAVPLSIPRLATCACATFAWAMLLADMFSAVAMLFSCG